ncbi:hypothetical protein PR202_gb24245 [Eleusine coracana subsp. coracana]|uniref:Pentatricopeptide repeat-containing protein n=1 Tax=Eleusine coracana subsp. coracana TaxID=191504 RepID=A0AAV5FKZ7_ELECO|nr:hypothetical protein PR202_gb24245 [Eleusine coracana subsp. coracana]
MKANSVKPDEVTFVAILSACSHAGLIDEGLEFFNCLTIEYSLKPVAEHYACMVDLLGRAGRLNEAFKLVQGMQIQATAGVWGALLGACRLHKNHELARKKKGLGSCLIQILACSCPDDGRPVPECHTAMIKQDDVTAASIMFSLQGMADQLQLTMAAVADLLFLSRAEPQISGICAVIVSSLSPLLNQGLQTLIRSCNALKATQMGP